MENKYLLDKKDKKILYQLDLDARQTFRQIGKKVGLSREVVQYRIKQLEKKGIIKGYQTIIDVTKLGYINCRFFIKFQKDSPEEEKQIIEYYKKNPKFWWVDSIDGFRDLGLAFWAKDVYEIFSIKEDLVRQFGKFIFKLDLAIYNKFYIYSRDYFYDKKTLKKQKILFSEDTADFDKKDLKILKKISGNARMNVVDISEKTKISVTNINLRIKKLIKKEIIRGFRAIIDLEKIGYYWYKIEFQLENLDIKKEMLSYFNLNKNIVYAYETISENDLEVELEVPSYEKFREILEDIRKRFVKNIKLYRHLLWYKEHKFLFIPDFNS